MLINAHPDSYQALYDGFDWKIPAVFNIGYVCADAVASQTPHATAIIDEAQGIVSTYSFDDLARLSNKFANVLVAYGIGRGDRVGIMVPQSIEAAAVHLAVYKCGAIAVPMAIQFGPDAIAYRLKISGAKIFVSHLAADDRVAAAISEQAVAPLSIIADAPKTKANSFWALTDKSRDSFACAQTAPDDPAMMLFTSGTTGLPKAALHGHRVLAGHLPGIQMSQGFMPKPGDRMWTPSDWAWAGGLLNALLPSLALGMSVVAARTARFSPQWAAALIESQKIANIFMPATALRLMLADGIRRQDGLAKLRTIGSAGEALGSQTLAATSQQWGLTISEFYGQTECNTVLGACAALNMTRPGAMGKQTPGHQVAVLGADFQPLPLGEIGQVAVKRPDPAMFLNYWNDPIATAEKFAGDWLLTGDQAYCDDEGFFHFVGRDDDIIISSGYRIGPTEIEDVLTSHPDVSLAAVVGKDDAMRTQIVTAYVTLNDPPVDEHKLIAELKQRVRARLSAHQMPQEIHFVETIPVTESGKIIRRHFREKNV